MRSRSPEPSQRQLRVGEQIKHIIAETLQRGHFHDEALVNGPTITVTEVRVTPDLKQATAFVIALGGGDMGAMLPALNENAHMFQQEINRHAQLKFTPRVTFKFDSSYDQARRIDEILSNIHYSDQEKS